MSDLTEIKDLLTKKGEAVDALQKALEKQSEEIKSMGGTTAETREMMTKANEAISHFNETKATLEERLGLLESAFKRGKTASGDDAEVPTALVEYGKALSESFFRRCDDSGLRDLQEKAVAASPEFKAMAVNSQADGGYLVTPDMTGRMATVIRETSQIRALASVQAISTDALEGIVNEGRLPFGWVAETQSRAGTATTEIGLWRIPTHECYCEPAATQKFLEDAAVNVEQWLIAQGGETFALGEETAFVVGDGVVQPRGIVTYTPIYTDPDVVPRKSVRAVKTGAAGDLTNPDRVVQMVYRLKQAYRRNATWLLDRTGQEKVRLLKQDNKYVWRPGLEPGQPDRLLGYPVSECNDLPAWGVDGNITGVFGDIARAYQIVDRVQMSVLRDPYTAKPMVKFYMRRRVGGDVISFDPLVYMVATTD